MPQEAKSGKPTARRYTDTEKAQAVRLVRQLRAELGTDHGTVKRIADQLGYGAENGTWRDFYLSGAMELRDGQFGTPTETNAPDVIGQLTPAMLFDAIAIQVNGPAAWDEKLSIDIVLTDTGERYRLRLANGVLTYSARPQKGDADATLTTTRKALPAVALGGASADGLASAGIQLTGDASALTRLTGVLDPGDKDFSIVTP